MPSSVKISKLMFRTPAIHCTFVHSYIRTFIQKYICLLAIASEIWHSLWSCPTQRYSVNLVCLANTWSTYCDFFHFALAMNECIIIQGAYMLKCQYPSTFDHIYLPTCFSLPIFLCPELLPILHAICAVIDRVQEETVESHSDYSSNIITW